MVERSVDPSVIQRFGGHLVGPLIGWSFGRVVGSFNLSVCRYGFDRLLGSWLVGCLLPRLLGGMVGCLIGGFICFLGWLVSCSVGWLMSFVFS